MIEKYAIRLEPHKLPFQYLTIRLEGSMLTTNLAEARLWNDLDRAEKVADFVGGIAVKVFVEGNNDVRLAILRPLKLIKIPMEGRQ